MNRLGAEEIHLETMKPEEFKRSCRLFLSSWLPDSLLIFRAFLLS